MIKKLQKSTDIDRWLMYGYWLGFALVTAFWFIEAISFPGLVQKIIGVSTFQVTIFFTLLAVVIRLILPGAFRKYHPFRLPEIWVLGLFAVTAFVAILFYYLELLTYPNFVFSLFHIHHGHLAKLALFFLAVGTVQVDGFTLKQFDRTSTYLTPIILILLATLLRLEFPAFFANLVSEDSWIEYATVVVYVFTGYIGLSVAHATTKQPKWFRGLWLLIGLGSLFIAGEEVSWGQRILGIEPTVEVIKYNAQKEYTIHNLKFIFDSVYPAYFVLSFFGATGWLWWKHFYPLIHKKSQILVATLVPEWQISSYFYAMLAYSLLLIVVGKGVFDRMEEFSELLLAIGICLFVLRTYRLRNEL